MAWLVSKFTDANHRRRIVLPQREQRRRIRPVRRMVSLDIGNHRRGVSNRTASAEFGDHIRKSTITVNTIAPPLFASGSADVECDICSRRFGSVPNGVDISTSASECSRERSLSWAVVVGGAGSRTGPSAYAALMVRSRSGICWRNSGNTNSVRDRGVGGSNHSPRPLIVKKARESGPFCVGWFRFRSHG